MEGESLPLPPRPPLGNLMTSACSQGATSSSFADDALEAICFQRVERKEHQQFKAFASFAVDPCGFGSSCPAWDIFGDCCVCTEKLLCWWLLAIHLLLVRIKISHRVTAQQVVGMLFESSSDHDYKTDPSSQAEEEVRDSSSEFSVREDSSDEEATLSADEGPVLEEDIDVPRVQQPGAEGFPIRRPDTWIAPNMEQPQVAAFTGIPGCRVNT
ncbi:hypothetical protein NDU88_004403 [Pleurodeles waltl]|uniref:Uncharacterized protein n=1 Tax=Pleurodeles waltl TaxID=8319 RepID=A0AAV7UJ06_PLEWA|nr:hypothetical protein NDU88_004403 [Pleurodeles waltl]